MRLGLQHNLTQQCWIVQVAGAVVKAPPIGVITGLVKPEITKQRRSRLGFKGIAPHLRPKR
jgi:hypothetical protein